jgi:hypothetical protein
MKQAAQTLQPKATDGGPAKTSTGRAISPERFRAQAAGTGMGSQAKSLCIDRRRAAPVSGY